MAKSRWMFYYYLPVKSIILLALCISLSVKLSSQKPTYYDDIHNVIQSHCSACHDKNQIGPMPLTNYEEVSSYASMIKYVITEEYMPPWQKDYHYQEYQSEITLSEEKKKLIANWIDSGMPKGKEGIVSGDVIQVKSFDPDLTLGMETSFEQYGIYYDQYHTFVLDPKLDNDVMIEAIEFVPGNTKIVRACMISVDSGQSADSIDRWDPRYGYNQFGGPGFPAREYSWYAWSPGQKATYYFNGYKKLEKGDKLIMHMTYGPSGIPVLDSSYIKLKLTKNSDTTALKRIYSKLLIDSSSISNPPFEILPGEKKRYHASIILEQDILLHSLMPQGQLICNSWEIFARIPEKSDAVKLLKIPEWDFHWKRSYTFKEPIYLPKGTEIHALASYDNTDENYSNPAYPPTTITYGWGMFQELFAVSFEYSGAKTTNQTPP